MFKKNLNSPNIKVVVFSIAIMLQISIASPPPFYEEYQAVQKIAGDVTTPEKKVKAVADLIAIVNDANKALIRVFAAEKLGDLGAIEAKDTLKSLSDNLGWGDSTRQLRWAAYGACWKIRLAQEPNESKQRGLLMEAIHIRFDGLIAGNVQAWAANELANRGVKEALPEIAKSIKERYSGERAEKQIWLCTTKIECLSSSKNRLEALTKALATRDLTDEQWLTRWAITELGKLSTRDSQTALIEYALQLQSKYYDENGKWKGQRREDPAALFAGDFYQDVLRMLRASSLSDEEIKSMGLRPDKFFIPGP